MKKTFFQLLICLLFNNCFSQYVEDKPIEKEAEKNTSSFWDKTFIGGNFGLMFGNITIVDLSPNFGYNIIENFSAGIGVTYIYFNDKYFNFSTNIYGGRLFARHILLENFLIHTEYEILNMDLWDKIDFKRARINYPRLLVGGGLRQNIGTNSSLMLLILFNVLDDTEFQNRYSFQMPNPDIRMGITIGF